MTWPASRPPVGAAGGLCPQANREEHRRQRDAVHELGGRGVGRRREQIFKAQQADEPAVVAHRHGGGGRETLAGKRRADLTATSIRQIRPARGGPHILPAQPLARPQAGRPRAFGDGLAVGAVAPTQARPGGSGVSSSTTRNVGFGIRR